MFGFLKRKKNTQEKMLKHLMPEEYKEKKETVEDVHRKISEIEEELTVYRSQFEMDARTFEDFYYGKQHLTAGDKKTVKNLTFSTIEGIISSITDGVPGVQVYSEDEESEDTAMSLNLAVEKTLNDQRFQLKIPNVMRKAHIGIGVAYLFPYWDYQAKNGAGDMKLEVVDWRDAKISGNCELIEEAEEVIIYRNYSLNKLKKMYPKLADKIEEELRDQGGSYSYTEQERGDLISEKYDYGGSGSDIGKNGTPKRFAGKNIFRWKQVWFKDDCLCPIEDEQTLLKIKEEILSIEEGDPVEVMLYEDHKKHIAALLRQREILLGSIGVESSVPEKEEQNVISVKISELEQNQAPEQAELVAQALQQCADVSFKLMLIAEQIKDRKEFLERNPNAERPKYLDGWRVIECVDDFIFKDGGNYLASKGIGPTLVPFYAYKDDTIYGFSEVKNIFSSQTSINDMDTKEFQALKRNYNTGFRVSRGSKLTESDIHTDEGLFVRADDGEFQRLDPPIVSPAFATRRESDRNFIERITGQYEQSQGGTSHQLAGVAIRRLQMAGSTRTRLKVRYMENYSIIRLGEILAALIVTHWGTHERFLITNEDEKREIYYDPEKIKDLDYKVKVSAGSMAGKDQDSINEFYYQMLANKNIDLDMFIELADFPKKEKLKSMIDKKKEQGEIQMQGQQELANNLQSAMDALQQKDIEIIKYKARFTPELVTQEEMKILDQITANEMQSGILQGTELTQEENEMNNLVETNNQQPLEGGTNETI